MVGKTGDMSEPRPLTERGRPHGRPVSWVLVVLVAAAFALGGASMILQLWLVFWICVAVIVLCVPVGLAIGIMEDTVGWTLPMSAEQRRRYHGSADAAAQAYHDRRRAEPPTR